MEEEFLFFFRIVLNWERILLNFFFFLFLVGVEVFFCVGGFMLKVGDVLFDMIGMKLI